MITRAHRFHGHGSLNYVYRHGRTVRGPLMSLRYCPNTRRETYRMAVVVSKKVNKSAVVRNRIRRRVFEAARLLEDSIQAPHDLVFTVFTETVADLPSADITRAVRAQLQQAGVVPSVRQS